MTVGEEAVPAGAVERADVSWAAVETLKVVADASKADEDNEPLTGAEEKIGVKPATNATATTTGAAILKG